MAPTACERGAEPRDAAERHTRPERWSRTMTPQTLIYLLAAIVAAALLVYLLIALLKPEWFQ